MARRSLFRVLTFSLLSIALAVGSAAAVETKQPSGYVIMPVGGEFLIDLDAAQGVSSGDLFRVLAPGERIVHPVTGKVLGTTETEKGVLQVTRVKSGYSYAVQVAGAKGISRGDVINRIDKLPVVTSASKVSAPAMDAALEARLKALEQRQTQMEQVAGGGVSSAPYRLDAPPVAGGPVSYGAAFGGFKNVGNLPGVTMMADFVKDGDRLLIATTDGSEIIVQSVGKGLSPVARGSISLESQISAVHWWRPEAGGSLYLAVSSWLDGDFESAVFALEGSSLRLVEKGLQFVFGAFDRDGDGFDETLLGQRFDVDGFWGHGIRQFRLTGSGLSSEKVSFELPRGFIVQGSLFADITGNGRLETIFVRNGMLYVFDGKKQIYRSSQGVGGSLSIVGYETAPDNIYSTTEYGFFEVPPIASDLDGDGLPELVVVAADRNFLETPGIGPGVKKSWLGVFKFRQNMFVKGTLGEEVDSPIQGVTIDGNRALFVVSEAASFLGKGGASHLLSYSLNK